VFDGFCRLGVGGVWDGYDWDGGVGLVWGGVFRVGGLVGGSWLAGFLGGGVEDGGGWCWVVGWIVVWWRGWVVGWFFLMVRDVWVRLSWGGLVGAGWGVWGWGVRCSLCGVCVELWCGCGRWGFVVFCCSGCLWFGEGGAVWGVVCAGWCLGFGVCGAG